MSYLISYGYILDAKSCQSLVVSGHHACQSSTPGSRMAERCDRGLSQLECQEPQVIPIARVVD